MKRWKIYQYKFDYVKDIEFDKIIDCIYEMINQVESIVI